MKKYLVGLLFSTVVVSCNLFEVRQTEPQIDAAIAADTLMNLDTLLARDTFPADNAQNKDTALIMPSKTINTGSVQPDQVMQFAESLIGVKYVYGSTNPNVGFDCSGFITYVFNHFKIPVPRSSVDFTNVGQTVPLEGAKRGDIILFTGTNPAERQVGHMGLVMSHQNDSLTFIHSTSGKAMGVTISPLSKYYKGRFVRICRIFPQNNG